VIRLDGNVCVRCDKGPEDGKVLQVHHKRYIPGRLPWQYPSSYCETVCKGCHASEHGIIAPQTGWQFVGADDLGDLVGVCDWCGSSLRHVFMIAHEHWPTLEVGTDCCDNLTCSEIASNYRESVLRFEKRRERFVASPKWEEDEFFHTHSMQRKTARGYKVVITVRPEGSVFAIGVNGRRGKQRFESIEDAKSHVFDALEDGSLDAWLCRPKKRG